MNCLKCGTLVNESAQFCSKCGAEVAPLAEMEMKPVFCPKCGQVLSPEVPPRRDPKCGIVISSAPVKYAGFGLRFGAILLDSILLSIVTVPISFFIIFRNYGLLPGIFDPTEMLLMQCGLWSFLYFIPSFMGLLYFVIFHSYGQTLGKKIAGIKVIKDGGDKPGFGRALLRETVGRFIAGIVLCLGYIWVGWDKNKQGWHDKIAGTFVVHSS